MSEVWSLFELLGSLDSGSVDGWMNGIESGWDLVGRVYG